MRTIGIFVTECVDRVIGRHGILADPAYQITGLSEGTLPGIGAGRAGIAHASLPAGTVLRDSASPLDETLRRVSAIPSFEALGAVRNRRVLTTTPARNALVVPAIHPLRTAIRIAPAPTQTYIHPRLFRRAMVASRTFTVVTAHRSILERETAPPELQITVLGSSRTVLVKLALRLRLFIVVPGDSRSRTAAAQDEYC